MIYIHTGGIALSSTSVLNVTPMSTGYYAGLTFFQDPANTSNVRLSGTSTQSNAGTFYFPNAQVTVDGPSINCNQLIAGTLVLTGTSTLNVNYDGRNPNAHHRAFLVR